MEEIRPAEAVPAPTDREALTHAVAKNIATLRQSRKMTQLELGEALNYSDKAISKWERAEAVPDAFVLSDLSRIFSVSVDWLLSEHTEDEVPPIPYDLRRHRHVVISLLSFFGTWTLATIIFVTLALAGFPHWQTFIYALPASLIVLLVMNSIWGKRSRNFLIVGLLVAACILSVYIALLSYHYWMLFLLIAPAELCVLLSYLLARKK